MEFPIVRDDLVGTPIRLSGDSVVRGRLFEMHDPTPAVRVVEFGEESSLPNILVHYSIIDKPYRYITHWACYGPDVMHLGAYEVYPERWYIIATKGVCEHVWGIVQPIVSEVDWKWYIDWHLLSHNGILIGSHTNRRAFWKALKHECGFGQEFEEVVIRWMPERPVWP